MDSERVSSDGHSRDRVAALRSYGSEQQRPREAGGLGPRDTERLSTHRALKACAESEVCSRETWAENSPEITTQRTLEDPRVRCFGFGSGCCHSRAGGSSPPGAHCSRLMGSGKSSPWPPPCWGSLTSTGVQQGTALHEAQESPQQTTSCTRDGNSPKQGVHVCMCVFVCVHMCAHTCVCIYVCALGGQMSQPIATRQHCVLPHFHPGTLVFPVEGK